MHSTSRPPTFSGYDTPVNNTDPRIAAVRPNGRFGGLSARLAAVALLVIAAFAGPAGAQSTTEIRTAKDPVIVSLPLISADSLLNATPNQWDEMVQQMAGLVGDAVDENPGRLVTLDPGRGRLLFVTLPGHEQAAALQLKGDEAPVLYELAMASLLDEILDAATSNRPDSALSVLGLPFEPQHTLPGSIRDSNDRYQRVIDDLAALISYRCFILLGSKETEHRTVQRGLPEAFSLREGRPLIFRTNAHWSILFGDAADFNEFGTESLQIADAAEPHARASAGGRRAIRGRRAALPRDQRIVPGNRGGRLKPARTKSPTAADQGTRPEIVAGD